MRAFRISPRTVFWLTALARGLAVALGGFALLNVAGELAAPGFDANLWWIDVRPLHGGLRQGLLVGTAVTLVAFAWAPPARRWSRTAATLAAGLLMAASLADSGRFVRLVLEGRIAAELPVPFTLLVSLALGVILAAAWLPRRECRDWERLGGRCMVVATVLACLVGFPLAQMCCFGLTDYRRPADAIVVFGAKVYGTGQPSAALEERIRTGCRLYRDGYAPLLVFSGGPGLGKIHETEAMQNLALELGVPAEAIVLDRAGLSTEKTARNTSALFDRLGVRRVLAVSHFYHLPRIKLSYQRLGRQVYTVPIERIYILPKLPYYMAREIAALWTYYLRPLRSAASLTS